MKRYRFEFGLAAILLAFVAAVWCWQNPGVFKARASDEEITRYMNAITKLPMPPDEKTEILKRSRQWLESDDGKPVYMLNLMRYYPELRRFPGAPEISGTPVEANAKYESVVVPMLLQVGGQAVYAGASKNGNLMEYGPELDNWNRVLLVRYPSRRAFLDLVTREDYAPIEPYKIMALQVVLTPTTAEVSLPEYTWFAGTLALIIFLTAGWWRSARRTSSQALLT